MTTAQEVAPYVVEIIEAGPAAPGPVIYGQAYRLTGGSVNFAAQNTFYNTGLAVTQDAIAVGLGVVSGQIGLQNTSGLTRAVAIKVEIDVSDGNNVDFAFRLTKNGTAIPATETRTHIAGTGHVNNIAISWLMTLASSDSVVLQAANLTGTSTLTIQRARIIAGEIA